MMGHKSSWVCEEARVLNAYAKRKSRKLERFFGYESLAHLMRVQERHRETLRLLAAYDLRSLADRHILDVGCGDGNMLRQFLEWGATPENLAGIDLRPEPVEYARSLNPNLDVRCGSATDLPWPDASFDLVCQHTVFTSILDTEMRHGVAREMIRVLRRKGAVLWYDFVYDNPRNPDVRGVGAREVRALFPGFDASLRRVTLAPPIARRLPEQLLPVLYPLLSSISLLRTNYLGLLIKP